MAERTFDQIHKGYWREPNKGGIPAESGIYCIYECTHNQKEKTVTVHKLIYIGESYNVRARIANHEKQKEWEKHVREGNVLCYNFTPVNSTYRVRVEAAYIYSHKPPENTEYVDSFSFDKTIVKTSGENAKLKDYFVANTSK